jgi:ferric-dicitrate binding protein FerR (iron transport regulator)
VKTGKNRHIDHSDLSKAQFEKLSNDEKVDLFVEAYRVPQKRNKAEALELLRTKIDSKSTVKPTRSLRIYWAAAASIAFIALLTTVYLYNSAPSYIIADRGQQTEYTLPDGSRVNVNADSKISYSKSRFTKHRILKLEGEAFFSVQKGKPFVVETRLGNVEVLGTNLNVYVRNNNLSVACLTGKVKVTARGESLIIEPGEKADLISGELHKTANIKTDTMASWRTGEFHFESVPLISIFEEVERQFNVSITANGLDNRYFTGDFSNKDLNVALQTICLPMQLDYEIINEKEIRIKPGKE